MLQLVVERGGQSGQTWSLEPGMTSIGRSIGNRVVIPGNQISRVHCVIESNGQGCILSDRSTNGTIINGKRATAPVAIKAGDRIEVGPVTLRVEETGVPAAGFPVPTPLPLPVDDRGPSTPPADLPPARPSTRGRASARPRRARRRGSSAIAVSLAIIGSILLLAALVAFLVFTNRQGAPSRTPGEMNHPTAAVLLTLNYA